jgi:phosphoglycerate kinase
VKNVTNNKMILDIGPKTIVDINKIIDISKTVLWNGPAGYFENHNFSEGKNLPGIEVLK